MFGGIGGNDGSVPLLLSTMNLVGETRMILAITCKNAIDIEIMARKRYPLMLRSRKPNSIVSSLPYRHVAISLSMADNSLGRGLFKRLARRVAILNNSAAS